jgi:hypothetical protein
MNDKFREQRVRIAIGVLGSDNTGIRDGTNSAGLWDGTDDAGLRDGTDSGQNSRGRIDLYVL